MRPEFLTREAVRVATHDCRLHGHEFDFEQKLIGVPQ